jgi:hypothetical protein
MDLVATNDTFILPDLGARPAVVSVSDLPCRLQVAQRKVTFSAAKPGVADTNYSILPIAAGSLVIKAWLLVNNACTATSTAHLGYSYGSVGSTVGDDDFFDATAIDLATIQSISVPAVVAGTLEATDGAAVGVYFPVDGYITILPQVANVVAGEITVVAMFIDLSASTGDPQASGATTRA